MVRRINLLVVVLSHVRLLLILLALGLAIGAVPVHQHHQGQHEHQVGDQDCVCDRGQRLRPKMLRTYRVFHNNRPKIIAYCSKIKSPGDFLGLWASHQI